MKRTILIFLLGLFIWNANASDEKWVRVNNDTNKYTSWDTLLNYHEPITKIEVYYPFVKRFPKNLMRFTNVDTMILFLCALPKWPKAIKYFDDVKHLEIWHPGADTLPAEIGEMKKLESLVIVKKGEFYYRQEWTDLPNLRSLKVIQANVHFPDEMYKLQSIEQLYLIDTYIPAFPVWIKGLKNLRELLVVNYGPLEVPAEIIADDELRKKFVFKEKKPE